MWRLFLPLLLGFGTSFLCPVVSEAGQGNKARPPPWVFWVVWTLLYLAIGWSWEQLHTLQWANITFIVLIALLTAWVVAWGCGKSSKAALYLLVLAWGVTVYLAIRTATVNPTITALMVALLTWLTLALQLNYTSVVSDAR